LNTTLTPHSIIHGDACFAYFNKIWGIPLQLNGSQLLLFAGAPTMTSARTGALINVSAKSAPAIAAPLTFGFMMYPPSQTPPAALELSDRPLTLGAIHSRPRLISVALTTSGDLFRSARDLLIYAKHAGPVPLINRRHGDDAGAGHTKR
jgi:hypothetical protein